MSVIVDGIAKLFFTPLGLHHFLTLSALLFGLGLFGVLSRRNAIGILMSLELMLNAVNINLVAFWRYGNGSVQGEGQMFALFVITVAAAEAAVGLAIILAIFRLRKTVNADEISLMKG